MADGFCEEMKKTRGVKTKHFLDTVHLNRSVVAAVTWVQIKLNTDTKILENRESRLKIGWLASNIAWRTQGYR